MQNVEEHYTQDNVVQSLYRALKEAGLNLDRLTPDDLSSIDEFHIRGAEATLEMAAEIGLNDNMQVLDIGSGLGGPSRRLAATYGCRVTGLDLTAAFVRVAGELSARLGLDHLVSYRTGNALNMPFEGERFDAVWTQHTAMNIGEKDRLYAEMFRVSKPGAYLAIYDVMAGPGGDVHYPVPWARDPSISFLATPAELRGYLEAAGFDILSWRDTTAAGLAWFRAKSAANKKHGPPKVGYHILLGNDFPKMARNQLRSFNEKRMTLLQVIARRPAE